MSLKRVCFFFFFLPIERERERDVKLKHNNYYYTGFDDVTLYI